jgi:hypothetical protein
MKKTLILVFLLACLILLSLLSSEAFADFVGLGGSYPSILNEPLSIFFSGVGMLLAANFFRKSTVRN